MREHRGAVKTRGSRAWAVVHGGWLVGLLSGLVAPASAHAAATIVIDDADPAGQGLNDPTPLSPVGGNPATTLGAARLGVFQRAASLWGATLVSAVPVHVTTQFTALTCDATSAVLGATGATTVHRNFASAPLLDTWYPQALANALAGTDLDAADADISTEFNSGLGTPGCMPTTTWYLGFDGNPGPGQIDMLTVVLHELAHGLGFQTFEALSTGAKLLGFNDAFLVNARQLGSDPTTLSDMTDAQRVAASESDPSFYWAGANVQGAAARYSSGLVSGHVRLFGPSTQVPGSSVSHYAAALTPNELMEPSYAGPNHDLTLTLDLLRDLGWPPSATSAVVPALPAGARVVLALALLALSARTTSTGGRRRPRRCGR